MSYASMEPQASDGPRSQARQAIGREIWVYEGNGGWVSFVVIMLCYFPIIYRTTTFWRFQIEIPLAENEMAIRYNINNGQDLLFYVPGRFDTMRVAAYSVS
jgi:hypothetical protein